MAAVEDGFLKHVERAELPAIGGPDQTSFIEMTRRLPESYPLPLVFFADQTAMSSPEHTLFVAWAPSDTLRIRDALVAQMLLLWPRIAS